MRRRAAGIGAHAGAAAARGAAAAVAGRSFEAELEATHAAIAARGDDLALTRGHPALGGAPRSGLYIRAPGDVDFVGHWEGMPVAFDAKSEAGAASYRHLARDVHELDFLLRWRGRRRRGRAFLLVRDVEREPGRVYLLEDLATLRAGGSVALRAHARDGGGALVPCLEVPAHDRLVALATGRPVWDWTRLLA